MRHPRLLIVPCLALLAAPLAAQTSVDVGPLVGYYRPFGQFDPASVYSTSLPSSPRDLSGRAWGATAQLTFGARFGVEAQGSLTSSTIGGVISPEGPSPLTTARVLVLTAQAQYDVSPAPRAFRLWLSAGPALVRHGGDTYAAYGAPTSVGGALGVAVTRPLGTHLQAVAGATTLLYTLNLAMPADLRGNPGSLEHGFQRDALLHVGVRWVLR